eukprot:jgi/Bigna1/71988/fgenesh1_pg.18_\
MTSTLQFIGMVISLNIEGTHVTPLDMVYSGGFIHAAENISALISRLRALKVKRYIVPEDDEKGTIASGKVCHNSSCVICLEEFKLGTSIKVLPCKHGFHSECIVPWLRDRSDKCPICKQTIVVPSGRKVL